MSRERRLLHWRTRDKGNVCKGGMPKDAFTWVAANWRATYYDRCHSCERWLAQRPEELAPPSPSS